MYVPAVSDRATSAGGHAVTVGSGEFPRRSTSSTSGTCSSTRFSHGASRRPCGMRRPRLLAPVPLLALVPVLLLASVPLLASALSAGTRRGSRRPQAVCPSLTHRLSQVARAPRASSALTRVDPHPVDR